MHERATNESDAGVNSSRQGERSDGQPFAILVCLSDVKRRAKEEATGVEAQDQRAEDAGAAGERCLSSE
jgi:hypothetical protein